MVASGPAVGSPFKEASSYSRGAPLTISDCYDSGALTIYGTPKSSVIQV